MTWQHSNSFFLLSELLSNWILPFPEFQSNECATLVSFTTYQSQNKKAEWVIHKLILDSVWLPKSKQKAWVANCPDLVPSNSGTNLIPNLFLFNDMYISNIQLVCMFGCQFYPPLFQRTNWLKFFYFMLSNKLLLLSPLLFQEFPLLLMALYLDFYCSSGLLYFTSMIILYRLYTNSKIKKWVTFWLRLKCITANFLAMTSRLENDLTIKW